MFTIEDVRKHCPKANTYLLQSGWIDAANKTLASERLREGISEAAKQKAIEFANQNYELHKFTLLGQRG